MTQSIEAELVEDTHNITFGPLALREHFGNSKQFAAMSDVELARISEECLWDEELWIAFDRLTAKHCIELYGFDPRQQD